MVIFHALFSRLSTRRILPMSKRFVVMMTFAFLVAFGTLAVSAQEKSETAAKPAAAGRLTIVEPVKEYG
jgi:hypothetical protein